MDDDYVQAGLGATTEEAAAAAADRSRRGTDPDDDTASDPAAPTNVTVEDCSAAIEQWREDLGDPQRYGYHEFLTVTKSTLSGTETVIRVRGEVHGRSLSYTGGQIGSDCVLATAVAWLLDHCATPYVADPDLAKRLRCRAVPVRHLRVFVADSVWEYVDVGRDRGERVLARLHDRPEHTITATQRRRREQWRRCQELTSVGGDVRKRKHALARTARAKLGFAGRCSASVPDPHPEYEDWSLAAIRDQLDALRATEAAADQRRRRLDEAISEARDQWFKETVREAFPDLADRTLKPTDHNV